MIELVIRIGTGIQLHCGPHRILSELSPQEWESTTLICQSPAPVVEESYAIGSCTLGLP